MTNTTAELKGSLFPLSILQLEDNDLTKLVNQLQNKLAQAPSFFYRAPLVINIEKLENQQIDFSLLKSTIEQLDFICVGICNGSNEQKTQARIANLAVLKQPKTEQRTNQQDSPKQTPSTAPATTTEKLKEPTPTKVVSQNIRSGQQIYEIESDLVIIGSVGNGAEVIADGSIHIYGTLRGRAIAGASGDQNAAIFSLSIEAELVSIAGTYWLSESLQSDAWKKSGMVKLEHEQLVIEPLLSTQN